MKRHGVGTVAGKSALQTTNACTHSLHELIASLITCRICKFLSECVQTPGPVGRDMYSGSCLQHTIDPNYKAMLDGWACHCAADLRMDSMSDESDATFAGCTQADLAMWSGCFACRCNACQEEQNNQVRKRPVA